MDCLDRQTASGSCLELHEGERSSAWAEDRTRHVDVRIIAATNRKSRAAVARTSTYRLSVFPSETTPLRDRREDIVLLATACLQSHIPVWATDRLHLVF